MTDNPERQRLCVAAIIRHHDPGPPRVLLSLRTHDPKKDHWHLPGGGVEFAESLAEALKRELREELGIEVGVDSRVSDVAEVVDAVENRHVVTLYYGAAIISGEPKPLDGTEDVGFFTEAEAKKLRITDSSKRILRRNFGWEL
jgi:8-oxo-dGTP diphosphatase